MAPIRLLTYGSQLRAYFGRIFPELLGPRVLGTPPVRSAKLWSADPWSREVTEPAPAEDDPGPSVVERLGGTAEDRPRWRNLWRRTDFLGFPVGSYVASPTGVDVAAEETDETGYLVEIVTHGDYPRAPAYLRALDDLSQPEPPQR